MKALWDRPVERRVSGVRLLNIDGDEASRKIATSYAENLIIGDDPGLIRFARGNHLSPGKLTNRG